MTCKEIENLLPACLDDILSPEERKKVESHLVSCPGCSQALIDLKNVQDLLHGLGEVEPPPFFEQRIMYLVREEAKEKKGIFQRLFHPLHIKIPIQALVMLCIAVLSFYVYQKSEPEMKQMAPLSIPVTEKGDNHLKAKIQQEPASSAVTSSLKQAPSGYVSEKERRPFAAPMAPTVEEKQLPPSVKQETLNSTQERSARQGTDKAMNYLAAGRESKEKKADVYSKGGADSSKAYAPAPSRTMEAAAIRSSAIILTLKVRDINIAVREVEINLGRINARIIERQHYEETEVLKVEMRSDNVPAFLERLEAIGNVRMIRRPSSLSKGVTVSIKIFNSY